MGGPPLLDKMDIMESLAPLYLQGSHCPQVVKRRRRLASSHCRMWLHSYDIVIRGPRPNCGFGLQNLHRKESRAFYLLDRLVVNSKYLITGYT